jgi:hypothetical protein
MHSHLHPRGLTGARAHQRRAGERDDHHAQQSTVPRASMIRKSQPDADVQAPTSGGRYQITPLEIRARSTARGRAHHADGQLTQAWVRRGAEAPRRIQAPPSVPPPSPRRTADRNPHSPGASRRANRLGDRGWRNRRTSEGVSLNQFHWCASALSPPVGQAGTCGCSCRLKAKACPH